MSWEHTHGDIVKLSKEFSILWLPNEIGTQEPRLSVFFIYISAWWGQRGNRKVWNCLWKLRRFSPAVSLVSFSHTVELLSYQVSGPWFPTLISLLSPFSIEYTNRYTMVTQFKTDHRLVLSTFCGCRPRGRTDRDYSWVDKTYTLEPDSLVRIWAQIPPS